MRLRNTIHSKKTIRLKTLLSKKSAFAALFVGSMLSLTGTPHVVDAAAIRNPHDSYRNLNLYNVAKSTWNFYVSATQTPTGLPADRIDITSTGQKLSTSTNDTNIGMYLVSIAAAKNLGIIHEREAARRLAKVLSELQSLQKYKGFFYDWYSTTNGKPSQKFVSTVDVAWLDTGLIIDSKTFPQFKRPLTRMLKQMNFSLLYDTSLNQLYGGYTVGQGPTGYTFGNINTETRIADYIAIGKRNLPSKLWFGVYRTLPKSWTWQQQTPVGYYATYDGVKVFEGHYSWDGIKYVPSWGGSMFESLMPTLFLNEKGLAPRALGLNDKRMVQLQIKYAQSKNYPVWGISPAALPNDGYGVFGIPQLGSANPPYQENGTITPYASFLALQFAPRQALRNIYKLKTNYHMLGKYGFYDSVNVHTSTVTHSYLALDEGMILASLDNYLNRDALIRTFNRSSIGRRPQHLLSEEKFSITSNH
ncbi:glucoamylase family protein [Alicyclobacillus sp. SO9]|uniref:glucoamylase family protein n=1 Tax=Alicyclobacillus sp. SO9 TaxID=2665646 RepID=UPI0018E84218|nr:glucoamylase family protein [Alicyclobacillus sp. SO9]QQE79781.1 DUF3131 domain-containing protein [Alicyclobacillus sp. SO9]